MLLTHGAGGNRESPMLVRLCDQWAGRGWLAVRYDLPYRRRRPKGPPSGSAAADQAGIVEAVALARTLTEGPVLAGGHSYGGRMTSMAVADGLAGRRAHAVLLSAASAGQARARPHRAPAAHHGADGLHPRHLRPVRHHRRTARRGRRSIPAPTEVVEVTGARHDLGSKTLDVPALAVDAALRSLAPLILLSFLDDLAVGRPEPAARRTGTARPAVPATATRCPTSRAPYGRHRRPRLPYPRAAEEVAHGPVHRARRCSAVVLLGGLAVAVAFFFVAVKDKVIATDLAVGDCITDIPNGSLVQRGAEDRLRHARTPARCSRC